MINYLFRIQTQIGIICLILFFVLYFNNNYLSYSNKNCFIVDKIKTENNFYFILKYENTIFDIIVSPSTYVQYEKGENVTFNLRPMDIKQTIFKNIIFIFVPILSGLLSFTFLTFGLFIKNDETNERLFR